MQLVKESVCSKSSLGFSRNSV